MTKTEKYDKIDLQNFNFPIKGGIVAEEITVLTKTDFEQKLKDGFFTQGETTRLHNIEITHAEKDASVEVMLDEMKFDGPTTHSLFVDGFFGAGLTIYHEPKNVKRSHIRIQNFHGRAVSINDVGLCNVSINDASLPYLYITDCDVHQLHLNTVKIGISSIELGVKSRKFQISYRQTEIDRLIIEASGADEGIEGLLSYGKFMILLEESIDLEESDDFLLKINQFFKTDIPQLAHAIRLLCPMTPIHFSGDLRHLAHPLILSA